MNINMGGMIKGNSSMNIQTAPQSVSSSGLVAINSSQTAKAALAILRSLSSGESFSADITDVKGSMVTIKLDGGQSFTANMLNYTSYNIGDRANFILQSNQGESIVLKALPMEETAFETNMINQSLNVAGIASSGRNREMVLELMHNNMPISREALGEMVKELSANPEAAVKDIVALKRMGIEVTKENLNSYENYKNYNGALRADLNELADSVNTVIKDVASFKSIVSLLTGAQSMITGTEASGLPADKAETNNITPDKAGTNDTASYKTETSNTAPDNVETNNITSGNAEMNSTTAAKAEMNSTMSDKSVANNNASAMDETSSAMAAKAVTSNVMSDKTEAKGSLSDKKQADSIAAGKRAVVLSDSGAAEGKTPQINVSDKGIQRIQEIQELIRTDTAAMDKEQSADAKEIVNSLGKMIENYKAATGRSLEGTTDFLKSMQNTERLSVREFMTGLAKTITGLENEPLLKKKLHELVKSDKAQRLISGLVRDSFSMSPSALKDGETVKEHIARSINKLNEITEYAQGNGSKLLADTSSKMSSNMEFLNYMNQFVAMAQVPLKHIGDNGEGELYVYRRKKSKEDDTVKAFLHLDMEHLGAMDIYVTLKDNKVSTNFKLADVSVLDFLEENIHLLTKQLNEDGYNVTVAVSDMESDSGFDFVKEVLMPELPVNDVKRFRFDMKA